MRLLLQRFCAVGTRLGCSIACRIGGIRSSLAGSLGSLTRSRSRIARSFRRRLSSGTRFGRGILRGVDRSLLLLGASRE